LLVAGRYAEVPAAREGDAHGQAAWAFARYHLAPNKAVATAARQAHESGDDLGTFVLMLCQRTGAGLRRDRAGVTRLNFRLRTKLEKKEAPSPLELYMLSQCHGGDEDGRTRNKEAEKVFVEMERARKLARERLQKAAERGVAQACQDLALALEDP